MKKYFNVYADDSAYNNDTARKQLNASTVSIVGKDLILDGVNVEVTSPVMGDAVYHDAQKTVHFIEQNSLKKELLPADYSPIGVCGERQGSKIFIIHNSYDYIRMVQCYLWAISGYKLDGAAHDCTVTLQKKPIGTFTYTASTVETFASQLNDFLKANCTAEKPHIAYVKDGKVILQLLKYTSWSDYEATISGLTVDRDTMTEVPILDYARAKNGRYLCALWNVERGKVYFADDNESSSYNPSSPVSKEPTYPVCLPAYLGTSKHREKDMCAWLRSKYGEGREGWERYMDAMAFELPWPKGMAGSEEYTGAEFCNILKGTTVPDGKGGSQAQYPAVEYAAGKGFEGVKGLEVGDWFGPSAHDFVLNMRGITYGLPGITSSNADPINKTRAKMGFDMITSANDSWLFARFSSGSSWNARSYGGVDGGVWCNGYRVVPVALYDLGEN